MKMHNFKRLSATHRFLESTVNEKAPLAKPQSARPASSLHGVLARPDKTLSVEAMETGVAKHLKLKHSPKARKQLPCSPFSSSN